MKNIFIAVLVLLGYFVKAQVIVDESDEIAQMIRNYQSNSRAESTIQGYRIQIITTPDRRKMESARAKFTSMYPNVRMEWEHVSPYYQVRVGAYESKMDLMGFMIKLKKHFRNAIPVVSNIEKNELVSGK